MYFVYLPEYYRYTRTYDNTNYNLVKEIVNELKIPFIDIHKVFEKEQIPLKLFHLNSLGTIMLMDTKRLLKLFINY